MGRNYFSKHGGPYFINNGFSNHHDHVVDELDTYKPDKLFVVCISIAFVGILGCLGLLLTVAF